MNAFEIAATALLFGFVPLGVVAVRTRTIDGLVALEAAGVLTVLVLLCFAEGFHRSFEFGVAVVAAVMSWASGLLFARFLGRWL
ncbi:MAG TPA: monovalent cation/H+ antiporter complex subunit F [Gaiellaceae bacterium]|nr:monovalent cation/H+ antiporter complex subunit F [Gaiellaceae bacterium]